MLLQFAHPLIAAAVHEHSNFRAGTRAAARRLQGTVRAMLALTFGNEPTRVDTLRSIRSIHARVHGKLPVDVGAYRAGTPYSAQDPDLVLWVHATLLESVSIFYELLVEPLTETERDSYCAEAAVIGVELGAKQGGVPRSWRGLREYIECMYASGQITVGAQARELAGTILYPPFGILGAPAACLNRLLTFKTLPPAVLRQYGFHRTTQNERALALLVPSLRMLRHIVPDTVASWRAARTRGY